jgi:E3 ubiquitin-protein ligase HUWE1
MSHPDTDQDDREMDEEEFDEDLLEEDEDEDEEGVILRLEEGINGINVFDHIEVFGGGNNLTGDTLHVMPLGIFGTRRQGRSTSIYNLLGRASEHGVLDHPLLEEPSSMLHLPHQGQPGISYVCTQVFLLLMNPARILYSNPLACGTW